MGRKKISGIMIFVIGMVLVFTLKACDFGSDPDQDQDGFTSFIGEVESFEFITHDNRPITIYYVLPPQINSETRVVFVMHGSGRSGNGIAHNARTLAILTNAVVISPEFTREYFTPNEYEVLNIWRSGVGITPPSEWTTNIIDDIFLKSVERFKLNNTTFILTGFSAGGMLAHIALMYSKSPYMDYAIASSPGWWSFFDESRYFPRGIRDMMSYKSDLLDRLSNRKLHVLCGESDNALTD